MVSLFGGLPKYHPLPISLVQHMSPGFDANFCSGLNRELAIVVEVAIDGQKVCGGRMVVAPHDCHLTIDGNGNLGLHQEDRCSGQRPSGRVLLGSVAKA